ncbi:hypothetical protein EB796_009694 [Bugula neritina]|uniref:Uncharacterized protein n=1 Tax=Bugula neritina TaxID=10212 RepID=A0A7J7K016_BUGNE|nr:hypothetical protein EB796_009694 [Bugula neritina]
MTPSARSSGIDTALPSHKFGTRLGVHRVEKSVKPAIYDEYYGTTYVPSSGRDSWSAYRISDEALDDNDNLVYESAKKDYELMKRVNRQLLNTAAPPQNAPTSVPVVRTKPKSAELTNKTASAKTHHNISVHPVRRTVNVETPDLDTHAAIKNLKKRLLNVYDSLSMSKASSMNNRDSDMLAIRKEVEAIKAARANREKNLGLLSNQLQAHQREPYSFNKQSTTFSRNSSRM